MYEKRHRVCSYVCVECWDSQRGGGFSLNFYLAFLLKFDPAFGVWLKYEKEHKTYMETDRHTCICDIFLP